MLHEQPEYSTNASSTTPKNFSLHISSTMSRSLVLNPPLLEDSKYLPSGFRQLLGRFVTSMDIPLDNFLPGKEASLDTVLEPFKYVPELVTFKSFAEAHADSETQLKMTKILEMTYKNHTGADVDLEQTKASTIDLTNLEDCFGKIMTHENGKYFAGIEEMWKKNKHKLAWIIGITIVSGGKIQSQKDHEKEKTTDVKIEPKEILDPALASLGVPPGSAPTQLLDSEVKNNQIKGGSSRQETEFASPCLYSVRYGRIGKQGFPLKWKMAYHGREVFEGQPQRVTYRPGLTGEPEVAEVMHMDTEGLKGDLLAMEDEGRILLNLTDAERDAGVGAEFEAENEEDADDDNNFDDDKEECDILAKEDEGRILLNLTDAERDAGLGAEFEAENEENTCDKSDFDNEKNRGVDGKEVD
jgi:hypothetical protein